MGVVESVGGQIESSMFPRVGQVFGWVRQLQWKVIRKVGKVEAKYLLEKVLLKTVTVYLDLDCRRGEERRVGLMKFVWIF